MNWEGFFDEKFYKRELANRIPGVRLEELIEVKFESFKKPYFIDVLVGDGGFFEFKAVEALVGRHRAQLLNYMLLCDVGHGKLINIRPEDVEHEFVNTQWERADRLSFDVRSPQWNKDLPGVISLRDLLVSLLRDLGTGLEIPLYEEAVTHFFGGVDQVESEMQVEIGGRFLGRQKVRQIAPGIALKITGFDGDLDKFEVHARRLLSHVDLRAIAWVNINMKSVTFKTLEH